MKPKKRYAVGIAVLLMTAVFCYCQNNLLTVSEYAYSSAKIGDELDGMRIVQLSDLHNKSFGKRLLKKTAELEPDIIVITGDIADSTFTDIDRALKTARGAAEIADTYYITGNHDYWLEPDEYSELMAGLAEAGVTVLDNEQVTIKRGDSAFVLTGLNDRSLDDGTLKKLAPDRDALNILIAHEPQYIEDYAECGIDLALTGHAHGGQFRLPFIGGIIAPDQGYFPKYTAGEYTSGDMTMIVSRGLGNSVIPLRLFNRPEIVVVNLKQKKAEK